MKVGTRILMQLLLGMLVVSAQADDEWSDGILVNPNPPTFTAPPAFIYAPPAAIYAPPPVMVYPHPRSRFYAPPAVIYHTPTLMAPGAMPFSNGNRSYREDGDMRRQPHRDGRSPSRHSHDDPDH